MARWIDLNYFNLNEVQQKSIQKSKEKGKTLAVKKKACDMENIWFDLLIWGKYRAT